MTGAGAVRPEPRAWSGALGVAGAGASRGARRGLLATARPVPHRGRMMRTHSRGFLTVLLAILASCGDSPAEPEPEAEPEPLVATTIALSSTTLSFSSLGETHQLTAIVGDQNGATMNGASVTWVSSSSTVASVSSTGLVTAVAGGLATITATAGAVLENAEVTVLPLVVSGALLPNGVTGDTYSHALAASARGTPRPIRATKSA